MLSGCATATTAAESRFRISAANSRPRAVLVVALDAGGEDVAVRTALQRWGGAVFRSTASTGGARGGPDTSGATGLLRDLSGRPVDLQGEVARADLVVLLATEGSEASGAGVIGELCGRAGVTTTAVVIGGSDPADGVRSMTVAQLRPHATMLVTPSSADYFADMLEALRA